MSEDRLEYDLSWGSAKGLLESDFSYEGTWAIGWAGANSPR